MKSPLPKKEGKKSRKLIMLGRASKKETRS
jgi:hypothetical protein